MYEIKKLNAISNLIYNNLDKNVYNVSDDAADPVGILVRSAAMHEYEINPSLVAVARAGAGVNNIPLPKMTDAGVVVFNTPGANANAVKELVICALLLSCRDVLGGVQFAGTLKGKEDAAKQVESGKKAFVGPEIFGKTLGVVGLGAIGALVTKAALALGMKVVGYDPFFTEEKAKSISEELTFTKDLDVLFASADFITLHVPFNDATKGMVNAASIAKMKDGVRIVNCARGELVDNAAIIAALESGKVKKYVTDFPMPAVIGVSDKIVTIPHLGASTPEAEDNCAVMASAELKDYIENGNIKNSVNCPNLSLERKGAVRVTVLTREANAEETIKKALGAEIAASKRGDLTYAIADLDKAPADETVAAIAANALKV
ncbi:MAG: 3-phosphoglycerate dehydrogenase, partial [Clostridia bacterium]|nr:3-phosphoglycerate dehydrogenase [Clostridia bacterium]